MPHIVSTLSSDQSYTDWSRPDSQNDKISRPAVARGQILIRGKANIVMKALVAPDQGVITSVTDEQLETLKKIKSFNDHVERGNLKIIGKQADPNKVARDMKDRDESAPLNIEKGDFKPGGRAAGPVPKSSTIA